MKMRLGDYDFSFPNFFEFLMIYLDLFVLQSYKEIVAKDSPRILDCGSHIGSAALYYKTLYPNAHITCFEPNPTALSYLKKNIMNNKLGDVEIVPAAVWDKDGTIQFKHALLSWGDHIEPADSDGTFQVRAVRLEPYLKKHVDILKLDIEGAEEIIMKDIDPQLGNVGAIVMEYHSDFKSLPNDIDAILKILAKHHFTVAFGPLGKTLYAIRKHTGIRFPFVMIIHARKEN
jgi:FkbM family methyltransferase